MIDGLDGERAMNLVDALLQEDVLLGQHLADDGLNNIRTDIIRVYKIHDQNLPADVPRGLARGKVLGEITDEDSPFGLAEAPLG